MAVLALTDMLVLVNGADLTGNSSKLEVTTSTEELDSTNFYSGGWREKVAGLYSHEWTLEGFWEAGNSGKPDDRLWTDLGTTTAWTAAMQQASGSVAYFGNVYNGAHTIGGEVGTLAPLMAKGMGNGRVIRGELMHPAATARTTTGATTGVQLGALSSTQSMFAVLHVVSASGTTPTLDVALQSAATQGGSYTSRITFSQATTLRTSQLSSYAGAQTNTWWRVNYTIAGTSPSYLFAVAAGIVTT
jgi:hypothetical protein